MIQTHGLVLWRRPEELDIEGMTEISFLLLTKLKQYGEELSPTYLTVKKKSEARDFLLSKENLRELLEKK